MNPVRGIVGMVIVTVHHVHIAGEEMIPAPAAVFEFRTYMVKRHHFQNIIFVINDSLIGINAVLCITPAVRRVKCHFQDNPTSSQFSVK